MSAINRATVAKAVPANASLVLTGSAQLLVPRIAAQRCIEIQNVGASNVGLSLVSATPVIGAAGTITLAPGASWRSFEGFIPASDIYVIGTASQPVTCWYY